jgi:hypothetical protein
VCICQKVSSNIDIFLDLALLAVKKSRDRSRQFVSAFEEVEFQNKNESEESSAEFVDEISGGNSRASYSLLEDNNRNKDIDR